MSSCCRSSSGRGTSVIGLVSYGVECPEGTLTKVVRLASMVSEMAIGMVTAGVSEVETNAGGRMAVHGSRILLGGGTWWFVREADPVRLDVLFEKSGWRVEGLANGPRKYFSVKVADDFF